MLFVIPHYVLLAMKSKWKPPRKLWTWLASFLMLFVITHYVLFINNIVVYNIKVLLAMKSKWKPPHKLWTRLACLR